MEKFVGVAKIGFIPKNAMRITNSLGCNDEVSPSISVVASDPFCVGAVRFGRAFSPASNTA